MLSKRPCQNNPLRSLEYGSILWRAIEGATVEAAVANVQQTGEIVARRRMRSCPRVVHAVPLVFCNGRQSGLDGAHVLEGDRGAVQQQKQFPRLHLVQIQRPLHEFELRAEEFNLAPAALEAVFEDRDVGGVHEHLVQHRHESEARFRIHVNHEQIPGKPQRGDQGDGARRRVLVVAENAVRHRGPCHRVVDAVLWRPEGLQREGSGWHRG
ncbi:hypothetical protein BC830DRAFT_1159309 [Chytriomyces sp. MP71]|nr:hypothetical protein BC830DRAFT_1159309 [Chytriomyces sp. MP71]